MRLFTKPSQEQQGWGDTLFLKRGEPELVVSGWTTHCGGRTGTINNHGAPIRIDLKDCHFLQGPVTVAWMMKLFEVRGSMTNCSFTGAGFRDFVDGVLRDGHPIYFSPTGNLRFNDCRFINNAGNLQFVQRDYGYPDGKTGEPVVDEPPTEETLIIFNDCLLHNNSWNPAGNGGGGAAQIAAYNATTHGTNVIVHRCVISNTVKWKGKQASKDGPSARAAVVLWNECWEGLLHGTSKIGETEPNGEKFFSHFQMLDSTIRTTRPDRALMQFSGVRDIRIEKWKLDLILDETDTPELIGWPAIIDIDHNPKNPQRARSIKIDPVPGALGMIRHRFPDGEAVVTPVSKGYTWNA